MRRRVPAGLPLTFTFFGFGALALDAAGALGGVEAACRGSAPNWFCTLLPACSTSRAARPMARSTSAAAFRRASSVFPAALSVRSSARRTARPTALSAWRIP